MIEQLRLLVKLQNIDSRMNKIAREKDKMPLRVDELQRELDASEEGFRKVQEDEKDFQKRRRQIEIDLDEISEQIRKSKGRLLEIKTNKEYQAMLKEIEERERLRSDKEDEALEVLEELEKLTLVIDKERGTVEVTKKGHEKEKARLQSQMAELETEVMELSGERESLLKIVDSKLVDRYNFIKERRNGTAVVAVKDAICQACHMNIPPQAYNELQRGEEIMTCPSCQRIIYWLGHNDLIDEDKGKS